MKVEILASDTIIGVAELDHLDPPMGVAFGSFTATSAYDPAIHAGQVDGQPNEGAAAAKLTVRGPLGALKCEGVWIADCRDALDEIQVSVLGVGDFDTYFSDHPEYRAYWQRS